jgi:hypothetical protein
MKQYQNLRQQRTGCQKVEKLEPNSILDFSKALIIKMRLIQKMRQFYDEVLSYIRAYLR